MTSKELMKIASTSIRTLVTERDELSKTAEKIALATEIVETMVKKEMLASEDILPKLADLKIREKDELQIIQKALELGSSSNLAKLGEVSDKNDMSEWTTPEEKFVFNTIGHLL